MNAIARIADLHHKKECAILTALSSKVIIFTLSKSDWHISDGKQLMLVDVQLDVVTVKSIREARALNPTIMGVRNRFMKKNAKILEFPNRHLVSLATPIVQEENGITANGRLAV